MIDSLLLHIVASALSVGYRSAWSMQYKMFFFSWIWSGQCNARQIETWGQMSDKRPIFCVLWLAMQFSLCRLQVTCLATAGQESCWKWSWWSTLQLHTAKFCLCAVCAGGEQHRQLGAFPLHLGFPSSPPASLCARVTRAWGRQILTERMISLFLNNSPFSPLEIAFRSFSQLWLSCPSPTK